MELLRYAVFAVFVAAAALAFGAWAVRTRRVDPFSTLGRTLRNLTDPLIRPMEGWVVRRGGNPQNAGWWVFGIALVGGILVLTVAGWLVTQASVAAASTRSPAGVLRLVIYYAGQLVLFAIIVRVIASWFGAGRFNPLVRPAYFLTDWIIEPLRRIIPPLGVIDITPIVAWFLLQFGLRLLLSVI